jgi:hypothetical protein
MATATRPGAGSSFGLSGGPPGSGPGALRDLRAAAGVAHPPAAPAAAYTGPPIAPPEGPPVPLLQANGFPGTVVDFNRRVAAVVAAHTAAHGYAPSPALTLVVAKHATPDVIAGLFPPRPASRSAQILAADRQANPDDFFVTRPDGLSAPTSAFGRMVAATRAPTPTPPAAPTLATQVAGITDPGLRAQALAKVGPAVAAQVQTILSAQQPLTSKQQYNLRPGPATPEQLQHENPWVPVEAGFLPVSNFGSFLDAVAKLDKAGGVSVKNGQMTVGGLTLGEYRQQAGVAAGSADVPVNPRLVVTPAAKAFRDVGSAITTVKQSQQELKRDYPAYFESLNPDGNFNQDWVRAVVAFQSSATYYQSSTKQLAADNHFDNPAEFAKAWQAKQAAIRSDAAGAAATANIPLAFFGNGKSVLNFIDGDAHGWGFANVPTVALHTIVGLGKTAFFAASATSAGVKSNAAGATEFFKRILPTYLGGNGDGVHEALQHADTVLRENPTWLRIVYPDLPAHPTGALGAFDVVSNFALDIVIGNKLVVGGSAVKVGDEAALASNRYFKGATQLAYNSMAKRGLDGVGEASKMLQGGETLNVAAAEKIKAGEMTLAQYRSHVSDLYHTGITTVERPLVTNPLTRKTTATLEARQATLDARYNNLLDNLAAGEGKAGDYKAVTAIQNAGAKKLARKGLSRETTVKEALRNLAESKLLGVLQNRGDEPVVKLLRGDLDEAAAISKELSLRADASIGLHEASVAPQAATVAIRASETPNSGVLSSLRTRNLPNPSLASKRVKATLDQFDSGVKASGNSGLNKAADMVSAVRQQFARAAPRSDIRRIYDPKTPEDLYNWVVVNLKDRTLANKARNDFVVARANQDLPAVGALNKSLLERYAAEYPNVKGKPALLTETEGPLVEAESRSNLKFLSGREKATDTAFANLTVQANRTNEKLLTVGRLQRQVILSGFPIPGGESLFYKHAIADTLRRYAGGAGLRFDLNAVQKAARSDVRAFFTENPAALRDYSAARASAEIGEVSWLTRSRPQSYLNFNTGDVLGDAKKVEGAGAFLRHLVTDDALTAYRASTGADRSPLFRFVWHSSFYQNQIAASEDFKRDAQTIKAMAPVGKRTALLSELKKSYVQDYTDALAKQYKAIEAAGAERGIPDALGQALQVAVTHPGAKIDKALGGWISENKLAFDVRDAPVKGKMFDGLMQTWISKLLTFNKLNRKTFFDHIFYDTYGELTKAGWAKADAAAAATDLSRQQTVYHMLDFSNMLQVEQKLRWLSYYATKHRLYWTWIARQFLRKPLLAAAVADIGNQLNSSGNLAFTVNGHQLTIPVSRLVWVQNTEYPETSPLVETMFRTGKGMAEGHNLGTAVADAFASETATSGNVFTRNDQAIMMLTKSVAILSGAVPATFGFAVDAMSPVQRSSFNRELHAVILSYRAANKGRYPSEQNAVKAAVLQATGLETWRTNLFVPFYPATGQTSKLQQLHAQFDKIHNPTQRGKFLDAHPQLADSLGASADQNVYLHEQPLWGQFNTLTAARNKQLATVYDSMLADGYTTKTAAEIKRIGNVYGVAIGRLRRLDALTWKGDTTYPAGRVASNGEIQTEGPWASKLDGDPLAAQAFLHAKFPDITQGQLDAHTVGQTVVDLQNEAARIANLGWQKLGYPDAQTARDRLSQIYGKIDVFKSFPKNATQQAVDAYYTKFVDPYRAERTAWTTRLATVSAADKDTVYAEYRAWKEGFDRPVTVTQAGQQIRFPSPVSFGLTELPPAEYRKALAQAAASQWQDISGYEKVLLGVKTPPNIADGWAAYQETLNGYRQKNPGVALVAAQRLGLAQEIDKTFPGFLNDYRFSLESKVVRFEATSLYRGMPARQLFDDVIGAPARKLAAAIAANGSRSYYEGHWRTYIREQVQPWLAEPAQSTLRAELALYGPNFLNTLVSAGG